MSDATLLADRVSASVSAANASLADAADKLRDAELHLNELNSAVSSVLPAVSGESGFIFLLTVFVLACFVGYYIIWKVTPALHSPLMSVTNAISSVIIVGALIAAGPETFSRATALGFFAVLFASVNIFGGFVVTGRMLALFKNKSRKG